MRYSGGVETTRVAAAIIVNSGKILIARRSPLERLGGLWEFPGGKMERDESPEQTILREIREELDLQIEVGPHFMSAREDARVPPLELAVYWARSSNRRTVLRVHDRVAWVSSSSLRRYSFAPPDLPIVRRLATIDATDYGHT